MGQLSGRDIESLSRKLTDTLSCHELSTVVYSSTGDRLYDEYVAPGKPLTETIQDLLITLEKRGTTAIFLSEVYDRKQKYRPDVAALIAKLLPEAVKRPITINSKIDVQEHGRPQADGPTEAAAPGLERNIRPNLVQLDLHVWLERLALIERRVCRVELNGNAAGTGFLVGPDSVLTNWHVVENAKTSDATSAVTCRFDYLKLTDGGKQEGIVVPLHSDGCVSFSPYSAAEITGSPDQPLPTTDQLDYALLRLSSTTGTALVDGKPRGWIKLPTERISLATGMPLLIVQHPDGAPMKLAMDTDAIIGLNANGTRLRYTTNTEPGSSGSPCFDMNWDLVAIHHYGDPAWQKPLFNQGVPANLVRESIVKNGLAGLIGS